MSTFSGKSPVSILQELAAAKITSAPEYLLTDEPTGGGYKCQLTIGDLTLEGVANSKKVAKHRCAIAALEALKLPTNISSIGKHSQSDDNGTNTNYVGKLYEFCLKLKTDAPVFTDPEISNGKFSINCKWLSYVTTGKSSKKKLAKHLAAAEMLTKNEFAKLAIVTAPIVQNRHYDDVKINMSQKYVICSDKMGSPSKELVKDFQYERNLLECQLYSHGYTYNTYVIQKDPLIVSLKATTLSKNYELTFVKSCDTYEESIIQLLKKAIDAIQVFNM